MEAAASEYGVIVSADGVVDQESTERERERMRGERSELPEFDFGPLPGMDELRQQIASERREFDARLAGLSG